MKNKLLFSIFLITFLLPNFVSAQSGGNFNLSQTVVAGGGQNSIGGNFAVSGTIGQGTVGTNPVGGIFSLRGGFWAVGTSAPTAAAVSLSGRVYNGKGNGIISRVYIVLTDTATGTTRSAQTNPFGFYSFEELEVGRFYIIRAQSKNFVFTPDYHAFELLESREDVNFTGNRIEMPKLSQDK